MAKKIVETPLMKQYVEMKRKHPDAILLFRVGDFYETFSEDAIVASEILGITLTRRANGAAQYVELAGFPHHALDSYLPKLVRAGKRVAICEQLEDPKLTKKLVKRGITELVTPGVVLSDNVLDRRENNFLGALHFCRDGRVGVAFLDISTGEFLAAQQSPDVVDKLLGAYAPKELLIERGNRQRVESTFTGKYLTYDLDDWVFTLDAASERLLKQFGTASLKGFGIDTLHGAIIAAGAILQYLDITQHTQISHITGITPIEDSKYVRLDPFTVRNLELIRPMAADGASLLHVIDRTISSMGSRKLNSWVKMPLRDVRDINRRLDIVEYFLNNEEQRESVRSALGQIGDISRLTSHIANRRINPRQVRQLCTSLKAMTPIREICIGADTEPLRALGEKIDICLQLQETIDQQLVDEPPSQLDKGETFRKGVCPELDDLRSIATEGKDYLLRMQAREVEATGISSLKIGYNNVFGYYLEVTNTHKNKVPADWIRKQTLVNAERYITPELKEYEEKINGAQDRIAALESQLYSRLLDVVVGYIRQIQIDAEVLAIIDCLCGFAEVADTNGYNRPVVDDSLDLILSDARHPVIERQLPPGEPYISNSVSLNNEQTQIIMLTGPNMSGKSALLRQTALNVIMAQIGCFVAARNAKIGVIDKIFTRVGASDNISSGESTFMVEMNEAAAIINNMSQRSLILFDELGRGTSTYDGISIAWAIVEHIHEFCGVRPKTLFATHYHELNEMERSYSRIANYNVSVKEIDGKIVFLRKLVRGGSEHSFGIHVAKLAGMPPSIVKRANEVLHELEKSGTRGTEITIQANTDPEGMQMRLFGLDDPVLSQVRDEIIGLDIDRLTPMEALNKLYSIRNILTGK